MATIRERICNAGVSTLRQFLCLDVGVGGEITYTGEVHEISEVRAVELEEIMQFVEIVEMQTSDVEEVGIISEIVELMEDDVDGIC